MEGFRLSTNESGFKSGNQTVGCVFGRPALRGVVGAGRATAARAGLQELSEMNTRRRS